MLSTPKSAIKIIILNTDFNEDYANLQMDWQMDIQMAPCPNDPKFYQMCGSALVSHPKQEPQTFCGEYICKYNDIDGRYDIYQVTGYKRCHYLKYDQCIANNTMNECNFTSRILLLSCFFLIRPFHF